MKLNCDTLDGLMDINILIGINILFNDEFNGSIPGNIRLVLKMAHLMIGTRITN